MHFFETLLRDLMIGGAYIAPIFIHSKNGIAILNASEAGAAAILEAHQQSSVQPPVVPAPPAVQAVPAKPPAVSVIVTDQFGNASNTEGYSAVNLGINPNIAPSGATGD
jgi:hypothetical protein